MIQCIHVLWGLMEGSMNSHIRQTQAPNMSGEDTHTLKEVDVWGGRCCSMWLILGKSRNGFFFIFL